MTASRVVGIGCFGRPRTCSRILDKILENYFPGPAGAAAMAGQIDAGVDRLPLALIADGYGAPDEKRTAPGRHRGRVTGFYVAFMDGGPKLSVFSGRPGEKPDRSRRCLHLSLAAKVPAERMSFRHQSPQVTRPPAG